MRVAPEGRSQRYVQRPDISDEELVVGIVVKRSQ